MIQNNHIIILFIILFSCFSKIMAQGDVVETDSLILWQRNRKLSWDDFKGNPKKNPINEGANIKGSIAVIDSDWEENIPIFEVRCYFKKYESWTIVSDSISLRHEQGHFDIYELYTRKIRKAFDSLNLKKISNIKDYELIHMKLIEECSSLNNLYEESNFSDEIQLEWINRIEKDLDELKEYEYIPDTRPPLMAPE